jgi:hypothetical protein
MNNLAGGVMNDLQYNIIVAIRRSALAEAFNEAVLQYDALGGATLREEMMEADRALREALKEAGIKVFDRFREETDRGEMTVWMSRPGGTNSGDDPWRVALAGSTIREGAWR